MEIQLSRSILNAKKMDMTQNQKRKTYDDDDGFEVTDDDLKRIKSLSSETNNSQEIVLGTKMVLADLDESYLYNSGFFMEFRKHARFPNFIKIVKHLVDDEKKMVNDSLGSRVSKIVINECYTFLQTMWSIFFLKPENYPDLTDSYNTNTYLMFVETMLTLFKFGKGFKITLKEMYVGLGLSMAAYLDNYSEDSLKALGIYEGDGEEKPVEDTEDLLKDVSGLLKEYTDLRFFDNLCTAKTFKVLPKFEQYTKTFNKEQYLENRLRIDGQLIVPFTYDKRGSITNNSLYVSMNFQNHFKERLQQVCLFFNEGSKFIANIENVNVCHPKTSLEYLDVNSGIKERFSAASNHVYFGIATSFTIAVKEKSTRVTLYLDKLMGNMGLAITNNKYTTENI